MTLAVGCVLVTGVAAGSWRDEARQPGAQTADSLVTRAEREALAASVAEAAAEEKIDAKSAAEAVSRSGDRWSAIYTAREYEGLRQALEGRYVGVGLWVRRDADGRIEVARATPEGPAGRAGITEGDRIRSIDGESVDGRPVTEVVALLRGGERAAVGTQVELGLENGERSWRETLRRSWLDTEDVTTERTEDGALRIDVNSFSSGVGTEIRRAVRGADEEAGVLLDLRGNSGGLLQEAVAICSVFLDGGVVASYDVRGEERTLYAEPGGNTELPLVVLVDGGTMSAAELLAGALQDRGRAVVVGTRTFGKGSVQMPSELPDGSVAELTVGRYRTPEGRQVEGRGIVPEVLAENGAEERARTVLSGLGVD